MTSPIKKTFSKEMISGPKNFNHKINAKTEQEAIEFLTSVDAIPEIKSSLPPKLPPKKVSLATVERSVQTKIYFERYFDSENNKGPLGRSKRKQQLEEELKKIDIPFEEKKTIKELFNLKEHENLKNLREKITLSDFDLLKVIGHGAFGVVRIVREKNSGEVYAMKIIKKDTMLMTNQEAHVRAERDLLSEASEIANWIVRLIYTFQDKDYLYLVMEYLPGGDLLSLLIKKDIFEEEFAKFYCAQMILAIEETHKLGIIHRDIKPDNFLFGKEGNLKLSDFGLATDHKFVHNSDYYKEQRRVTLLGVQKSTDLENVNGTLSMDILNKNEPFDLENPYEQILCWRDNHRKKMSYSGCDWWSLGVILYEMLFGFPPFCSKNREQTKLKILNWERTLRFPPHSNVSENARDLIRWLLCNKENRLGQGKIIIVNEGEEKLSQEGDATDIKSHPWFRNIDFEKLEANPLYKPILKSELDSSHFDEMNEKDVFAEMEYSNNEESISEEEQKVLEMRKRIAFAGFTYKGKNHLKKESLKQ
ncbi:hypothetical protein HK099_004687 [Clydaea vesicula]|uniref:non-specific serine/threonine protein kinase n=1 Tax=Clydaea vesicula TaxID=447962 RepID=A0AAD5U4S7_9FUNG|nr:hypothetical protein HK099_004687 [Clydaea vesicula]